MLTLCARTRDRLTDSRVDPAGSEKNRKQFLDIGLQQAQKFFFVSFGAARVTARANKIDPGSFGRRERNPVHNSLDSHLHKLYIAFTLGP